MSCLDMERENTENVIKMNAEVGKNGHSPYINDVTQTWFVFDDISRKYVDTNIKARGANNWEDIDGKPESFPPSEHNHDDRYYTGQDVDMQIQNIRNEIPSLNGYATESWVESKGYAIYSDVDMQIQNLGQDVDMQIQNLRNEIPSLTENITGITVNGTDLPVEDKKVALPIGSTTNFGLVKGASGHGINVLRGEMRINAATEANIDARTANKPINTINLNYSVKAALTDENRISGLTDAEKKNACSTIGSVYDGRYELIEKITLTEDVTRISRATSPDGEAYNFKKLFIDYKSEKLMSNVRIQGFYKFGNKAFNYNCYIATNHVMGYLEIDASDVLKYYGAGGPRPAYTVQWCTTGSSAQIQKADCITSLIIEGTQALYAGTVINIYGVRA